MKKEKWWADYKKRLNLLIKRNSWQQVFVYSICAIGVMGLIAYFFYRTVWAVILLFPIGVEVIFYMDKERYEKQKRILKNQFQDMILSIATNLKVGYSSENSFLEAYTDLLLLYGRNSRIIDELEIIKKGLAVNLTLEKLLSDFDKNCQIEEISEFVDIFCLANKTGGNLVEVIETSATVISGKISTDEEIEVILSAGKMERHIMMGIPFIIIIYIELTNSGFFTPLYHNVAGIIIMSVCLMVYLAAVKISGKIISIRI